MSELTDKILKKQGIRTPPGLTEPKPVVSARPPVAATLQAELPKAKKRKPKKPRTPAQYDASQETKGRLPDGAAFTVVYHADRIMWDGSLAVPNVGVFTAECSGVFRLLANLDAQYRAKLAGEACSDASSATPAQDSSMP